MQAKIFLTFELLLLALTFSASAMEAMETNVKRLHMHSAEEQLFKAVDEENYEAVNELLQNSELDINAHDGHHNNDTALIKAFRKANIPIITALLNDPRTDITRKNNNDWSVVTYAVRPESPINLLQILLQYQKAGRLNPPLDLNLRHFDDGCALHFALEWRNWPAAMILSEEPAVDASICRRTTGEHPLHGLCEATELPEQLMLLTLICNLVERGAPVCKPNSQEKKPFDIVNQGTKLKHILYAFGETKAEDTINDPRGWYVFGSLCTSYPQYIGDDSIRIRQLPDPHAGMTPFMIVCAIGAIDDLKTFLQSNRGITLHYAAGRNPISIDTALRKGITRSERTDLAFDLDEEEWTKIYPNARGVNDWHALHFAAYNGHSNVVEYLLSLPVIEIKPRTTSGLTPIAVAKLSLKARGIEYQDTEGNEKVPPMIALFKRFEKARLRIFCCLLKVAPALPLEIKERIVNSYRFNCENPVTGDQA